MGDFDNSQAFNWSVLRDEFSEIGDFDNSQALDGSALREEFCEVEANRDLYNDKETDTHILECSVQYGTGTQGFANSPAPHTTSFDFADSDLDSEVESPNINLRGLILSEANVN